MKYITLLVVALFALAGPAPAAAPAPAPQSKPAPTTAPAGTFWVQADALGNGWGLYPINGEYGGAKPLGPYAAFGTGRLTWVADFPDKGPYQVWVRRYGGYGRITVSLDGKTIDSGQNGPGGGGKYLWRHLGSADIAAGSHHVDIDINNCMFDAILFTPHSDYTPSRAALPKPVADPVLRAPRHYRDDGDLAAAAGDAGIVIGKTELYPQYLNDWLPKPDQAIDRLTFEGAIDQYIPVDFAIRALKATGDLPVSLAELKGPDGTVLNQDMIDLRVVQLHRRPIMLFRGRHPKALTADFLVRDDRHGQALPGRQGGFGGGQCVTAIAAHESRQFHLVVHVPQTAPPGAYQGTLTIGRPESPLRRLLVELTVLPLKLQPVEGYYAAFFRAQPIHKERNDYLAPESYLAALKDQVRHGLNAATLYGGFDTLEYVVQAGMTQAPCLMNWPHRDAAEQIQKARSLGLPGLLYYGVDEPHKPEQIERAKKEALRRQKLGLPIMMAVNDRKAQKALQGLITHPIYNLKVFYGPDNPTVAAAQKAGHVPISYWGTQSSFPLYLRAFAGLYNSASGYGGTAPWDYYDVPYPDSDYGVVKFDQYGQPIPSMRWEAWRDGIDDVRYLQALDRAIAQAQKQAGSTKAVKEALAVRKKYFGSIHGAWHRYLLKLHTQDLMQARRQMARATIELLKAMPARP